MEQFSCICRLFKNMVTLIIFRINDWIINFIFNDYLGFVGFVSSCINLISFLKKANKYENAEKTLILEYCKFGNFCEGFIFANMRNFAKVKYSQNGKITLSFTDIGKSCPSCKFKTSLICILTLFAKINSWENFQIYSIHLYSINSHSMSHITF